MIWHYDMITGNAIDSEAAGKTTENIPDRAPLPAPRLMSVQEETAEPGGGSMSPAVVMLAVERLLAQLD